MSNSKDPKKHVVEAFGRLLMAIKEIDILLKENPELEEEMKDDPELNSVMDDIESLDLGKSSTWI